MPENPILPGFHPDPCLCRVGDDYYLATSTFEWFPGVALFHSRDLARWTPIGHALAERRLLDLESVPDSGGVWAPCLTHADGLFWLVFTVTRNWGATMDTPNYLVTAPSIHGPWSEPVFLNSSGFDPSLYHAPDGRKYLLNMRWDHRPGKNPFAGIVLQEYDPAARRLVGTADTVFAGTALGKTEGPHLYHHDGYHWLLVAEGGTEYGHAVSLARAREVRGPYEPCPRNPILSARSDRRAPLQKTGHGSLVRGPGDDWFMALLCGRHLPGGPYCNLGRETALVRLRWPAGGWPEPESGPLAPLSLPAALADAGPNPAAHDSGEDIRFAPDRPLPPTLQSLRSPPAPDWCGLTARPGWLRLRGRQSLRSRHRVSLLARRLQHHRARFETRLECAPRHFQHLAGLAAHYDGAAHYFLHVTHDEQAGRCLRLLDGCTHAEIAPSPLPLPEGPVWFAAEFDQHALRFEYSLDGATWRPFGHDLEAARLSDEWAGKLGFTGTFVGLHAQDLAGDGFHADFSHLSYRPLH